MTIITQQVAGILYKIEHYTKTWYATHLPRMFSIIKVKVDHMSIEFISKFNFDKSDFMLCKHNNPLSSIKFPIHLRMCIMQLENMTSTVLYFVQFLWFQLLQCHVKPRSLNIGWTIGRSDTQLTVSDSTNTDSISYI